MLLFKVFKDATLDSQYIKLKESLVFNIRKALETLPASDATEVKTGASILQEANARKLVETLMRNLQYLVEGVGN
jgi:hypothetical protein